MADDRICVGAILGLLAGLALLEVGAFLLLDGTGGFEEARDAVGRLGALVEPVLHAVQVHLDAVFVVLGQQRVIGAQLFDIAAVAWHAAVGGDDAVERALLGATAREADFHSHGLDFL